MLIASSAVAGLCYIIHKLLNDPIFKELHSDKGLFTIRGTWFVIRRIAAYIELKYLRWRQLKSTDRVLQRVAENTQKSQSLETESHTESTNTNNNNNNNLPKHLPTSDAEKQDVSSVYFNGMDKSGTYIILRMRKHSDQFCDVWISLHIPDVGQFRLPHVQLSDKFYTKGKGFTAGGLTCKPLEENRRWRVTFNGILNKSLDSCPDSELLHVKFSLIWEAFAEEFSYGADDDDWLKAAYWTRQQGRGKHTGDGDCDRVEQWGELRGILNIENNEEKVLQLRGLCQRELGPDRRDMCKEYMHQMGIFSNGSTFSLCRSTTLHNSHEISGFFGLGCGIVYPITSGDLCSYNSETNTHSFCTWAGGKCYQISTEFISHISHDEGSHSLQDNICRISLNSHTGYGVLETCTRYEEGSPPLRTAPVTQLKEMQFCFTTISDRHALILPFTDSACTCSHLVGGKGCQLALLTQHKHHEKDYTVPDGFCLTIAAFQRQLQTNPFMKEEIDQIHKIASGVINGNLKSACERVEELWMSIEISEDVSTAIQQYLKQRFQELDHTLPCRFAVRSSATGEDGEDMSAAGQMGTVLGVKGLAQIEDAVQQCWASHYAFTAVEYRRQHGQPVTSDMGVVIQQMVPSEVSGVLFTRDPLTGHPGKISINANYGLGESVVSGSSDPDTISLSKSCTGNLTILNKTVGGKQSCIEMKDEEGGTVELGVSEDDRAQCCLSDQQTLQLASVAEQLEDAFGNARDIEWAFDKDVLYLLQARPITTLHTDSDWLLEHEFDTALAADNEVLTTANIGEMMPHAMTPLTVSTFFRAIDYATTIKYYKTNIVPRMFNIHKFCGLSSNHGFINFMFLYGLTDPHMLGANKNMADLAVLGEVIADLISKQDVLSYWGQSSWLGRLMHKTKDLIYSYGAEQRTSVWETLLMDYTVIDDRSAATQYEKICEKMPDYYECWADTVVVSGKSAIWSSVLMAVLSQGKEEWTVGHYSDVALMLSKCEDVYSADVPASLQALSNVIRTHEECADFVKMCAEDAVMWINTNTSTEVSSKYKEFLQRHGHRCIREAEFREQSWQSQPIKFVQVLQSMLAAPASSKPSGGVTDVNDVIKKLQTPVTYTGRHILRWVIPKARRAVGNREWGKSISIEMVEKFKQAYWTLAKLMRHEGYLPDEDLLFFLTHQEIGHMLKQRPATLVAKALRRRRLHATLMNLQFSKLNTGHPQCIIKNTDEDASYSTTQLEGMPVSVGRVTGVARVITSLKDASNIQLGDILIVTYTDVGWSPYFPLIAGLVTEIGGLLSHGAVVAREYGIPCLVNVQRATSCIKSGDEVILDGTAGTLQKIEQIHAEQDTATI